MLKLASQNPSQIKSELLVIAVCEDQTQFKDPIVNDTVQKALEWEEFSGKLDEEFLLYEPVGMQARRVLFVGMGKTSNLDAENLRHLGGTAVKCALARKLSAVDLLMPDPPGIALDKKTRIRAMLEGAALANYINDAYKQERKKKPLKSIRLLTSSTDAKKYTKLIDPVAIFCRATHQAREWINRPSNDKPPLVFADLVTKSARKAGLKVTLMGEKELVQKKFGALLAVAGGSTHRPCLLTLEYKPAAPAKRIVLVGKGVTFDAGGINLKPSSGMEEMKADMSGAAVVAAILLAAAELKPDVELIGVLPLVENLPSGSAYRPGDIVRSFNGKTIEIGNTDAEGRLILADAMGYATATYKPDVMIDLATLTGACVVALGEKIAGVFSPDDDLADAVVAAGKESGERCWRMPMPEDYKELIKSDMAEIRNVGKTRYGGAIAAALFLAEFVGETRWAHIDIAGPAYGRKNNSYTPTGASGFGVRLLGQLLEKL